MRNTNTMLILMAGRDFYLNDGEVVGKENNINCHIRYNLEIQ